MGGMVHIGRGHWLELARSRGPRRWLLVLLLLGLPATALSGQPGEATYQRNCSVCHGESGDGRSGARFGLQPPPASFGDGYAASRDRMIAVVAGGSPGTAMTAWGGRLGTQDIEDVVDFIRHRFMGAGTAATASPLRLDRGTPSFAAPVIPQAAVPVPPRAAVPRPAAGGEAARLYARNCSVCHGENGSGAVWGRQGLNPPPQDFTAAEVGQWLTRERMLAAVRKGRPGTAMAAFEGRLGAGEIEAIVDYIRVAFMRQPAGAPAEDGLLGLEPRDLQGYAPAPMDASMPRELIGDPGSGAVLFAGNCAVCHGGGGRGDGPRAYFIYPRPRDFTSLDARTSLNRPALYAAVRHGVRGRAMPGWRTVLDEQQIADVSEYVFQSFIVQE